MCHFKLALPPGLFTIRKAEHITVAQYPLRRRRHPCRESSSNPGPPGPLGPSRQHPKAAVADAHGLYVPELEQAQAPAAARDAEDPAAVAAMVAPPREAKGQLAAHAHGRLVVAHPLGRDERDREAEAARDAAHLAPHDAEHLERPAEGGAAHGLQRRIVACLDGGAACPPPRAAGPSPPRRRAPPSSSSRSRCRRGSW